MTKGYSHEVIHQLWDDSHGDRIEVGPDRDGLDLTEIRYVNDSGQIGNSITFTKEQLEMLLDALIQITGRTVPTMIKQSTMVA